jgi:tRNA (cytidine/uridine-2'-O-)-methyltransferase
VSIHVVLVHPEIHWNTGNAARSCLAAGATLHLVKPLGFRLDEREIRRAGLDYWEHVDLRVWDSWPKLEAELDRLGEAWFFSGHTQRLIWDAPLGASQNIVLVFGPESTGFPEEIRQRYADRMLALPMFSPHVRSLNVSTCVGIALYEVLRQRRG